LVAFAVKHTAGLLTVALPAEKCERLDMPIMAQEAQCADIAYTVAVDAAEGIGTGIRRRSAVERSVYSALHPRSQGIWPGLDMFSELEPARVEYWSIVDRPRWS